MAIRDLKCGLDSMRSVGTWGANSKQPLAPAPPTPESGLLLQRGFKLRLRMSCISENIARVCPLNGCKVFGERLDEQLKP